MNGRWFLKACAKCGGDVYVDSPRGDSPVASGEASSLQCGATHNVSGDGRHIVPKALCISGESRLVGTPVLVAPEKVKAFFLPSNPKYMVLRILPLGAQGHQDPGDRLMAPEMAGASPSLPLRVGE